MQVLACIQAEQLLRVDTIDVLQHPDKENRDAC
jgi:hypothetical protein